MKVLVTGGSGFIGTNLVEALTRQGVNVLNVDVVEPRDPPQTRFWFQADIMDEASLDAALRHFEPTHVVHLAGRTDCVEGVDVYEEYGANIVGSRNLTTAVSRCASVEHVLYASTQFVCGPDHYPKDMDDYAPHTVYGQSKVLMEREIKGSDIECTWTIFRPVNVWGPWHMRYRREAWNIIRRGFYLHPGGEPVRRCYGYVENVVWQIRRMIDSDPGTVDRKVFYVGDDAVDIYEWVNAFSLALRGTRARKVPRAILRLIAVFGDAFQFLTRTSFPLTSSRYQSMTQDYLTPIEETLSAFGTPPVSLQEGVRKTVRWLEKTGW